jgi:hypothetical protein
MFGLEPYATDDDNGRDGQRTRSAAAPVMLPIVRELDLSVGLRSGVRGAASAAAGVRSAAASGFAEESSFVASLALLIVSCVRCHFESLSGEVSVGRSGMAVALGLDNP